MKMSNIKWGPVALGVLTTLFIAYGSSICVVSGYAGYLGFLERGTPDQAMINDFADRNAAVVTSLFFGVGTFIGGRFAARRADENVWGNGLMVGVVSGLVLWISSFIGGAGLWDVVAISLAVGGGWMGGRSVGEANRLNDSE